MQNQVYNLDVELSGNRRAPRVGVLEGRTGIPVFLLFLQGFDQKTSLEAYSTKDVELLLSKSPLEVDQAALKCVLSFFESGGSRAHLLIQPLSKNPKKWLTEMIGKEDGYNKRSGIFALRGHTDVADLVVCPQASLLLNFESLKFFYQAFFDFLEMESHFFLILDFPVATKVAEILPWLKKQISPNAAAFFPWLVKKEEALPPSAVVASALEQSDEKQGIHHLPSNQPIRGAFKPLFDLTPAQIAECLENRLNSFHPCDQSEIRIWGGYTLAAPLDMENRFISTRRTILAIREAIVTVCEPFVLEPLYTGLEKMIEVTLQSAFQPLKKIFNPESKNPFETEIKIIKTKGQEVIQIQVDCSIPYVLDEMRFSLGLAG